MVMELDQSIRVVGPDGSEVVVQAALGEHVAFKSCWVIRWHGWVDAGESDHSSIVADWVTF